MEEIGAVVDYLDELGYPYEEIGDLVWRVNNDVDGVDNIIVSYNHPIIMFRINLMEVPKKKTEAFYRRLLELNIGDLPHGAFGIDNAKVVLVDTLEAANLDFNEFQSSIDALSFAVSAYYEELTQY